MADERYELEARFFDGAATAEEQERLAAGTADQRRADAMQLLIDRVLRQLARPALDPGPVMEAVRRTEPAFVDDVMRALPAHPAQTRPPSPWARRSLVAAFTASLAAAAVLLGMTVERRRHARSPVAATPPPPAATVEQPAPPPADTRHAPSLARLTAVTGDVEAVSATARRSPAPNEVVAAGETLVTRGPDSTATLEAATDLRIIVGGEAVVAPLDIGAAAAAFFVSRGVVTARRGPRGGVLALVTPHGRAQLAPGTAARLTVDGATTRLQVTEGEARLAGGTGGEVAVAARRFALVTGGGEAVVGGARGGVALLLAGELPLRPGDRQIRARLESLGFEVRVASPGEAALESQARSSHVVLVSSTVFSVDLAPRLRELPVPIVVWEKELFDDLGLTGACGEGNCGESAAMLVLMKDMRHPLAAGLSGVLRPTDAGPLTWGTPGIHAAWIATISGEPTRAVVFAYDRGAAMPGLAAPARRVGLFMGDWSATRMRPEGWRLFDAAVEWSAADAPP